MQSPLTIHNCTNEEMVCRYLRQGRADRAEIHIPARDRKMIQDAYTGMKIYSSTAYDPTSVVSFQVQQHVDEIFFNEDGGGYGKGAPVGPPAAAHDRPRAPQKQQKLNNAGRDDVRGTSLATAHSSDLMKQGQSGGELSEDGNGDVSEDQRVWVPGMGWMDRSAIPKHILDQLAMRRGAERMRTEEQAEAPPYPQYDTIDENVAVRLPPLRLNRTNTTTGGIPLTTPEKFISAKYHRYMRWPMARCDKYARTTIIVLIAAAFFTWWRKRR